MIKLFKLTLNSMCVIYMSTDGVNVDSERVGTLNARTTTN